ncbi:baseplate protein [Herbaspirillum sp. DW155]|uniref:phage baseplate assembly protein n=1 Tax=Herbaspirillum sp. DW155 TaxID=3095609 RepID=UPI00309246BD|nr:baseplate protein [Herbaspirillum sp. DW155]
MNDEIRIDLNGKQIYGWTSIHVQVGLEFFPGSFVVQFSEVYPGELNALRMEPGSYFELFAGTRRMVAGYVDRYHTEFSAGTHSIAASGRGKCQDLVDASAEWPGGQFSNVNAYTLAKNLVSAYGKTPDGEVTHPIDVLCSVEPSTLRIIPQLNLILGESAFDVLSRVARYSQLMMYEDFDGDLVLSRAGTDAMASSLEEGVNVQAARIEYSADRRFSEYTCFLQSVAMGLDAGDGGNLLGGTKDKGVQRNRKRYLIAEATAGYVDLCIERAIWQRNSANGRSEVITVVTDNWFDEAGNLWQPNRLVTVYLPSLKMKEPVTWLIANVNFKKDEGSGTTAELTIMHPGAYSVEPMALYTSNLIDTSKMFASGNAPYWTE